MVTEYEKQPHGKIQSLDKLRDKLKAKGASMFKRTVLSALALCLFAAPAFALLGGGFGVRGGLVSNYQIGGTPPGIPIPKKLTMLGVHTSLSSVPVLALEASLEYNWKAQSYTDPTYGTYKLRLNDFSANGFAKIRVPVSPMVKPYLGGGLGLHRLVYSVSNSVGTIPIPDDLTRPATHLLLGLAVAPPLMPLEIFGEYRWTWVNTPDKKTKFPTLLAGATLKL
jgi:hypothetical protein